MEEPEQSKDVKDTGDSADDWTVLERKGTMDFNEPFDYKPLKKGVFAKLEEALFKAARGKKKVIPPKKEPDTSKVPSSAFQPVIPKTSPVPMEKTAVEKSKEFHALERPRIIGVHPHPLPNTDAGIINLDMPPVIPDTVLPEIKIPVIPPVKPKLASRLSSINKVNVIINGASLAIFVTGAFILYSELPTRPELVIGIVMIAAASGVLATGR